MNYGDNVALINGLWQNFAPSDDLRDLFRDTFGGLDQDVLREAIKRVRQETDTAWPSVRSLLDAYRTLAASRRKPATGSSTAKYERTVLPAVDLERERVLVEEYHQLIDATADEEFYRLEADILDRYDAHAFSSCTAYRLLYRLRGRVFGGVAGLSSVTRAGDLQPLSLEGLLDEEPRSTRKHEPHRDTSRQADRRSEAGVAVHPRPPGTQADRVLLSPDRQDVRVERPERGGGPLPGPAGKGLGDVGAGQAQHDHPHPRVTQGKR